LFAASDEVRKIDYEVLMVASGKRYKEIKQQEDGHGRKPGFVLELVG
jgi:hypothetical protein